MTHFLASPRRARVVALLTPIVLALGAAAPLPAQTIDGIVVVGVAKRAVPGARLVLLDRRQDPVDTTRTDVFGGFTLEAPKPGRYFIQVRRPGFYPIMTERFELHEEETRTDTVFLQGRAAEMSVRDVIESDVQRNFGTSVGASFARWLGPEELEELRPNVIHLGDIVQRGRLLGLQWLNPPNGCLRFSGAGGCAQVFLDGLPVFIRPDQINAFEIEAVLAIRALELGAAATTRGAMDDSRFGAVMVYTSRFNPR